MTINALWFTILSKLTVLYSCYL